MADNTVADNTLADNALADDTVADRSPRTDGLSFTSTEASQAHAFTRAYQRVVRPADMPRHRT